MAASHMAPREDAPASSSGARPTERDAYWDNMRALLIVLVVIGHTIKKFSNEQLIVDIYETIFVFHMPAFIFVSGYFARFRPAKMLRSLLLPYLIFQVIGIWLKEDVLEGGNFTLQMIQFTTPTWSMWYLLVLFFFLMTVPFLELAQRPAQRVTIVLLLCVVSVLSSYDKTINRYLGMIQYLSFLPFFASGFYLRKLRDERGWKPGSNPLVLVAALLVVVALSWYQLKIHRYTLDGLFAADHYAKDFSPLQKAQLMVHGFAWIALLLEVMPHLHIPLVTSLGTRTLPIYLLHGFIIRFIPLYVEQKGDTLHGILLTLATTLLVLVLFGNKPVAWVFDKAFSGSKKRVPTTNSVA